MMVSQKRTCIDAAELQVCADTVEKLGIAGTWDA